MSLILVIKHSGKIVQELHLDETKSYVFGRQEGCDVVLDPEKGISREHFCLRFENGFWMVQVTSKFGGMRMLPNKEEVPQIFAINQGQTIALKTYQFSLQDSQEIQASHNFSDHEPHAVNHPLAHDEIADDSEKTVVRVQQLVPKLKLINLQGVELESYELLGGDTWIAGRDPANSIVINDPKVSRKQFEIKKIDNRYAIIDLKSVNGTYINGQPISSENLTYLKSQDQINVLSNHYRFELYNHQLAMQVDQIQAPIISSHVLNSDSRALSVQGQAPYLNHQYGSNSEQNGFDPSGEWQNSQGMPGGSTSNGHQNSYQVFRQKVMANKLRAGLVMMVVVFGCYGLFFQDRKDAGQTRQPQSTRPMNSDPLAALPIEKQRMIKQTYTLAKTYYMNGKYELCRGELTKLVEFNITNYLDSEELGRLCEEAIQRQSQLLKFDQDEKNRQEMEQKIQAKVSECRPMAAKSTSLEELNQCLQSVLSLNPEHPAILDLKSIVEQNNTQLLMQNSQRKAYAGQVQQLKNVFGQAAALDAKGEKLEAIPMYYRVTKSNLPDPGGLKNEARRRIASIQSTMHAQSKKYLAEAEKSFQEGNLKAAVLKLRKIRQQDPDNEEINQKIESYERQLSKRMKELYDESIIEESYGNVVGTDGKEGAIDKWKQIIRTDVPGNDYHNKASIKLRKYSAQKR